HHFPVPKTSTETHTPPPPRAVPPADLPPSPKPKPAVPAPPTPLNRAPLLLVCVGGAAVLGGFGLWWAFGSMGVESVRAWLTVYLLLGAGAAEVLVLAPLTRLGFLRGPQVRRTVVRGAVAVPAVALAAGLLWAWSAYGDYRRAQRWLLIEKAF